MIPSSDSHNSTLGLNNTSLNDNVFCDNNFSFCCISQLDVLECFHNIRSNAIGLDNLHPVFVKSLLPFLLPYITYIFNNILTKSVYPESWKIAKIIPIRKSNNDFRPIAILSYLSKVFEIVMYRQINEFFIRSKFFTDKQSGYRSKRNCTTALIDVVEDIREKVDNSEIAFLLLLDHSKAFDTIDHKTLCHKLINLYNIGPSAVKLIFSYLNGRSQSIFLDGMSSSVLPIRSGVPQGSVMGPFLFSVHVNDLPKVLKKCNIHMYADDVQLYTSCKKNNVSACVDGINRELTLVYDWATKNNLRINPTKTKCILIYKNNSVNLELIPKIVINNEPVEYVNTVKNLGVIFNTSLSWNNHIYAAIGKVYGMLRVLWTTQYFTPFKIRMLLAKTYLIPTLFYSCEIFANCDTISNRKINVAFNNIARYVFNIKRFDHISIYSKEMLGMSLNNFLNFRTITLIHKIISDKEPTYLYHKLTFTKSNRINQIIHKKYKYLVFGILYLQI